MTISATTVLRSRNTANPDKVLSTLLLRYPRWIHAEGRTHRLLSIDEDYEIALPTPALMDCRDLSRNAASGRAIPVHKMIKDVRDDPAIPIFWGKNIGGMQAKEELTGRHLKTAKALWFEAMESAIEYAEKLSNIDVDEQGLAIGAHKQIVNRILEPFSHITVLVSATEWTNFLVLRDHGDAEPHILALAREVRKCLEDESTIQDLEPGQWHLPFIVRQDYMDVIDYLRNRVKINPTPERQIKALIQKSTACCASTSYKTVEGFEMSFERGISIYQKLVGDIPIHASPAEHVAQADNWLEASPKYDYWAEWENPLSHGNFKGFRQHRKQLPNECL